MKVTFNTEDFTNTHGRAPKGTGLWAFEITLDNGRGGYAFETFRFNGSFTEAKKAAKAFAQSQPDVRGATIFVGA